jgi:hypothetical protein
MADVPKRSRLPGKLGEGVDHALMPGDDIIYEIKTYRGYGLVVTHEHLLLVVGGVMAGLKPDEQHIHRLAYDQIERIDIVAEPPGCWVIFGVPPLQLSVTPLNPADHDPRWNTLLVDYLKVGEAVRLVGEVHERIGRRKAEGQ